MSTGEPTSQSEVILTPPAIRDSGAKLSDRVAVEVGTQIVHADLPGGERLPTEGELGDLFNVSRSVIRDAIRTLSARGLVEVRQGHGMVVAQPTDAPFAEALIILLMRSSLTLGDVFDARVAIETELVPLAAEHGTNDDWHALRTALQEYKDSVDRKDWHAAQAAHATFHYSLLESIHLPALRVILRPMQQIILLSSGPPRVDPGQLARVWTAQDVTAHYPILDALTRRDSEAVREAMSTHFRVAREHELVTARSQTLFRESEAAQDLLREVLTGRSLTPGSGALSRHAQENLAGDALVAD